ncbi:hypothetical protein PR048_010261 [Dryococelus australis]|uniref:Uncharacterized protein n=1 Tax=Dryococelus australis TaxID=614101 RepID=A0ABQ9I2P5_9NEOP|nr:hypothetical protein PR048_010261 [Dryococelus australis]
MSSDEGSGDEGDSSLLELNNECSHTAKMNCEYEVLPLTSTTMEPQPASSLTKVLHEWLSPTPKDVKSTRIRSPFTTDDIVPSVAFRPNRRLKLSVWKHRIGSKVHLSRWEDSRTAETELLACSPPTKANRVQSPYGSVPEFRMWESCRMIPLVGGFSQGSPVSPALSFPHPPIISPSSALKTSLLKAA